MTAGDRLAGRFVLKAELGRGATGVVWEAWDEPAQRLVAVKLLHEHLTRDLRAQGILEAEAAGAGRLRHPGILEVFGLWAHEGRRLLVVERVQGSSLQEREGALALDEALEVGEQVARALASAHRTGRVHGDLRPGNVLLTPMGARVFDFGLASWVGSMEPTAGGGSALRPGEGAPEVLDGGVPMASSDLYGLGVVLVRALTGALPWEGPTPFAVIGAQRAGPPALDTMPRGVRLLCEALLQPEPDRRPADAEAVAQMLHRLRRHPDQPPGFGGRWVAPIRPLRAWVVHGRDPSTGGPCVVRAGLGRAPARSLVQRLREEGWQVQASREALDVSDLGWAAFGAFVGWWLVPLVGWLLAIVLVLRWRSAPVRDRLREALPPLAVPLPPRRLPPGNELAVAAGLLLLALIPVLALAPPLALPILAALAWLAWHSWRPAPDPEAARARAGRIATVLAQAARQIEARELDLDTNLGLHGELVALEREWRSGVTESGRILDRAEALVLRVQSTGAASRSTGGDRADDNAHEGP